MAFVICFDTICSGYQPITTETKDNRYKYGYRTDFLRFDSEEKAEKEIESDSEFYEDCFVLSEEYIGHKTIYRGEK